MTIERILKEIEARIALLEKRRSVLENRLLDFRSSKPYRNMTDRELDDLPRSSKFWREWNRYSNKIYIIEHEIRLLREMKYAYEHHD